MIHFEEDNSEKEQRRMKLIEENYRNRLELSSIPDEYMRYSLDGRNGITYDITDMHGVIVSSKAEAFVLCKKYISNLKKYKNEGQGIYYYGVPNKKLGMSLLGVFIIRAALEIGYTALFVPFSTICQDLDFHSFGETKNLDKYYDVDFLMIDSISKGSRSSRISDALTDIILTRRKEKRPTIFSSYIDHQTFIENYGPSIASYLEEFVIRYEIKNDPAEISLTYRIDDFKKYLDKKQREQGKCDFTGNELSDMVASFIRQNKFNK